MSGADRHADANLARPARHGVAKHTEDADRDQQNGRSGESAKQDRSETWRRHRVGKKLRHCSHTIDRQQRIHSSDLFPDQRFDGARITGGPRREREVAQQERQRSLQERHINRRFGFDRQ